MTIIIKNIGIWENKAYAEYTSNDGTDMLEVLSKVISCNSIDTYIPNRGHYKSGAEALIDGQYMNLQNETNLENGTIVYLSKDRKTLRNVEISRMGGIYGIRLNGFVRYIKEAKFITEDELDSMKNKIRNKMKALDGFYKKR